MNTPDACTVNLKAKSENGGILDVTMKVFKDENQYGNGTAVRFDMEGAEPIHRDTRYMDWGQWSDLMEFAEWQLRDTRGLQLVRD